TNHDRWQHREYHRSDGECRRNDDLYGSDPADGAAEYATVSQRWQYVCGDAVQRLVYQRDDRLHGHVEQRAHHWTTHRAHSVRDACRVPTVHGYIYSGFRRPADRAAVGNAFLIANNHRNQYGCELLRCAVSAHDHRIYADEWCGCRLR